MTKYIKYAWVLLVACAFTSCESTESSDVYPEIGNPNGPNHKYAYSYWATDYAQYIWTVDKLEDLMSGEINMKGIGIEQAGNMIPVGNRFFACSTDEDGGRSYYLDVDGYLATGGREDRIYVETAYAYSETQDDKAIIVGASWQATTTGNEVLLYDSESVSYINRKVHDFGMSLEGKPFLQWPSSVAQSGEYLYISYYPKPAQEGWNISASDTAYVKVLKYPSLDFVADIKDARTAPVGLYYANTGMVTTDSGDTYTFSSNALAAGYQPGSKTSAILRIKKNSTNFDPDYFLDVEASKLQGRVISAYPAGGELAVILYITKEDDIKHGLWSFFSEKPIYKAAIVDLAKQEILEVSNLPLVSGDNFYGYASLFAENGKAYKSFFSGDAARIYEIDLTTGVARAGAHIRGGLSIPVITKLNY